MNKLIDGLIVIIGVLIAYVLSGWLVSVLINAILKQIGLNTINTWAGCCLIATVGTIKAFINW